MHKTNMEYSLNQWESSLDRKKMIPIELVYTASSYEVLHCLAFKSTLKSKEKTRISGDGCTRTFQEREVKPGHALGKMTSTFSPG